MSDGIKHIAIIMDGNGRWAKKRLLPRSAGHKKGAEKVKEIAQEANRLGVKFLTLYAFSTENWQRPQEEVDTLMGLLRQYLNSDFRELHEKNIRIRFIGERVMLAADGEKQRHDPVFCHQLRFAAGNCSGGQKIGRFGEKR